MDKMRDWLKGRDQWLGRSWPWAWDVKAGLHPIVGIVASCVLIIVVSIGLSFCLRATGPLFGYFPGAPLYLYSAVAQSLAAYMTLALTALFIASQLLGPNYSWGFARLLVSQRMFQVALGINLGVITASLLLLVTSGEALSNTPLVMVAFAFAAMVALTHCVVTTVLSLAPSRFLEQCRRQAWQILAAGFSTSRENYLCAVIEALRDTGMGTAEQSRRKEKTINLAAGELIKIRAELIGRGEWEKTPDGEESETCRRIRWALIDVGTTGVWTEETGKRRQHSQVDDLLGWVWALGWQAYNGQGIEAWEDILAIAYYVARERRLADRDYWFTRLREQIVDKLGLFTIKVEGDQQIADHELPFIELMLKYALRAAFDAADAGQVREACGLFYDMWGRILDRKPKSDSTARNIALSFASAVASLGANIVGKKKEAPTQIAQFLPDAGKLLSEMVTYWDVDAGTFLEQVLPRFTTKHDRFTQALSDHVLGFDTAEGPSKGGVDPTSHFGETIYVILRCYLETTQKYALGFETMGYSESAAGASFLVKQERQGILQTYSAPLAPLLGGKELSSLLDGLEKKLSEYEQQREREEWAAIQKAQLSPEFIGQFKQTVKDRFVEARRVAKLLRPTESALDGELVVVRLTAHLRRQAFVEVKSNIVMTPDFDAPLVANGLAAHEDYELLRAIMEFVRSGLGESDLKPADISEMAGLLREIYDESACVVLSHDIAKLIRGAISFDYNEELRDLYWGRLGSAKVYLSNGLESCWAVSFIPEQIGDLTVSQPLQVLDPVDLPWDEEKATEAPTVSVELSEELLVALSADGEPRVWDLSQWISTEEAEA